MSNNNNAAERFSVQALSDFILILVNNLSIVNLYTSTGGVNPRFILFCIFLFALLFFGRFLNNYPAYFFFF